MSYDNEYGASMSPRSNPAFNDTWVIGATGGVNRVVPQGIDYSRTPCCTPGPSAMAGTAGSNATLYMGLIAVPLSLLLITMLFGRGPARNPAAKYLIMGRYKGGRKERIDEADSPLEAESMLAEYQMAFGPTYDLWVEGPEARRRKSREWQPLSYYKRQMPFV